jgi:iron complex transport system ATP-binding protein
MRIEAGGLTAVVGGREALRGVAFCAEPGALTAVVGPNGAGKTSLLRALAGLLAPRTGRVMVDGRPLAELGSRQRARTIAYLPQERVVHWALSARAIVALGRLPHQGLGAAESPADAIAIAAALAAVGANHLANRPVLAMSGGERARVLIARALAQEAPVLLADEPAAGLDPAQQLLLFAQLQRLAALGRTVVVALHDLSLAARFCRTIALLHEGRSVASGVPQEVLDSARLAAVYGIRGRLTMLDGLPVVLAQGLLP